MEQAWLEELREFISIPSVSADPAHRDDVVRAAEWLAAFVKGAGGEAEVTPFGTRGLVGFDVNVRTGSRDMHSGIYGGGALNAIHALMQILGAVAARDGVLPE